MDGYMKDARGRMVPIEMIKPIDLARDQIVGEIVQKSLELSSVLCTFKKRSLDDIRAFIALSAEQYGVTIGGKKGNVTLNSYDGEFRILIAIDERITFDERLQAAKALIDECIRAWTVGARGELKVLVDDAFAVDKQGKINTNRVLGLRRLDITDPTWLRAMEAISDSVTVTESKEYIRVYRRNDEGEYDLVSLDVSA
ncbi:MAG: sulfate transporter [Spirochaetes bacterium GWB1_59_5]|nr:MAG: sulfate transporter [Spirochaetes bacterium GWB1_59_5]